MKSYTITVNGNVYDVTVEETGAAAPTAAPRKAAPAAAAPAAAPAAGAGSVKIEAGAAGKVFKIEAEPGTAVKRGDAILVLEVMKMETPVVAPPAPDSIFESDMGQLCYDCRSIFIPVSGNQERI